MRLSLALIAVVALLAGPAAAATGDPQVAPCDPSVTIIGSGPADWRARSTAAGPLGVARGALRQMAEARNGQLYAKMPVLVEGSTEVTLRVPPGDRRRVFLYYGAYRGRDGKPTRSILGARGFSGVAFQPCPQKPRTVWPGGIRVAHGRGPVTLSVLVAGRPEPIRLRLGRPKVYRRP